MRRLGCPNRQKRLDSSSVPEEAVAGLRCGLDVSGEGEGNAKGTGLTVNG